MSQESLKLSKNDPYLIVLHRNLLQARIFYQELREEPQNIDRIRNHKFNVKWIKEEVHDACKNSPKWQSGRQHLESLIDIRHDLEDYYDVVFNNDSIEIQGRRFVENHHEFYAVLRHFLRLFA